MCNRNLKISTQMDITQLATFTTSEDVFLDYKAAWLLFARQLCTTHKSGSRVASNLTIWLRLCRYKILDKLRTSGD